ncbi:MAG: uroporphyrinogen decarboxylase family protein, partial [Kiritimatiellae bacterium]|nr:uroporphyrinogen decarboxylase family protein [Kiritimatiellia bacterium]
AIWSRMVRDVEFDLIEFWEDMASKNGCLISPDMFREFMLPQYRRVKAFAAQHNVSIILVDSDGYIDKLAGLMLDAGVTSMYPFEVGAGCNVDEVRRQHPTMGVIGGLAKEAMIYGKSAIDKEMEKARHLISLGRLIPGPDHFVQSDVSWENYRYFMERLREVVLTTKPEGQHRSAGDA